MTRLPRLAVLRACGDEPVAIRGNSALPALAGILPSSRSAKTFNVAIRGIGG